MKFEQDVRFASAYDKRSSDPKKNYGIGAMLITFFLTGPKGAVQFVISTPWYTPDCRTDSFQMYSKYPFDPNKHLMAPQGWDLGYHSHKPMYEDHTPMSGGCDVLGGKCYYDGSSLNADEWIDDFVSGGTEWLWPKMEEFYYEVFGK